MRKCTYDLILVYINVYNHVYNITALVYTNVYKICTLVSTNVNIRITSLVCTDAYNMHISM